VVSLYSVRLGTYLGGSRSRLQQHLVHLGQRRHGSPDGQWQVAGADALQAVRPLVEGGALAEWVPLCKREARLRVPLLLLPQRTRPLRGRRAVQLRQRLERDGKHRQVGEPRLVEKVGREVSAEEQAEALPAAEGGEGRPAKSELEGGEA